MSKKTWLIFAALCLIVIVGVVWLSRGARVNVDAVDATAIQSAADDNGQIGDHVLGNADAAVKIIEYGDFQCPGCKQAAPVLKQVQAKYPNDVALIFRNFPLVSAHPNARAAAASAEAVGLQSNDKFWEYYTLLYTNQDSWKSLGGDTRMNTFADYAVQVGADRDQFLADAASERVTQKVDFDTAIGRKVGVDATPTLYVNGEKADQYVDSSGNIVTSSRDGSVVWSSAENFDKYVIAPALQKAGIDPEKAAKASE